MSFAFQGVTSVKGSHSSSSLFVAVASMVVSLEVPSLVGAAL